LVEKENQLKQVLKDLIEGKEIPKFGGQSVNFVLESANE